MKPKDCILFIDAQNVYKSAREAFFLPTDPHMYGQIDPLKLSSVICSKSMSVMTKNIIDTRVYTGRPDATKDPRTYAAHMKQCAAWQSLGVNLIHRVLRYPRNWPTEKPKEKGIDVALALDIVTMAVDKIYNIGIVASTDTDLKPAIEYVYKRFGGNPAIEVMAWYSNTKRNRLSISGTKIWCHYLTIADYNACADPTDYTV